MTNPLPSSSPSHLSTPTALATQVQLKKYRACHLMSCPSTTKCHSLLHVSWSHLHVKHNNCPHAHKQCIHLSNHSIIYSSSIHQSLSPILFTLGKQQSSHSRYKTPAATSYCENDFLPTNHS
jgi:hypothetical protein